MAIGDPSAVEREASAFRRCFFAGAAVFLAALGGEAMSGGGDLAQACPHAPMAAADRVAQPRPELLWLQVGEVLGRAIVSELRGD